MNKNVFNVDSTGLCCKNCCYSGKVTVPLQIMLTPCSWTQPRPTQVASFSIKHIPLCVRWYPHYPARNLGNEMLGKEADSGPFDGISLVQHRADKGQSHLRPTNDSCGEWMKYIKVKGQWKYLYRLLIPGEHNGLSAFTAQRCQSMKRFSARH